MDYLKILFHFLDSMWNKMEQILFYKILKII